jgi:hypothetical protein
MLLRPALALLLAAALQLSLGVAVFAEETPAPTVTPTETATSEPAPTETAKPTRTPEPTATPTPLPLQDLAVSFFNNFCEAGQPLLATIFNASATPLENRTLRLRLSGEDGVLEEHDHAFSLPAFGTANLPLYNAAQAPWVKLEIELVGGVADPNPNNDSASCGVAAIATAEPTQPAGSIEAGSIAPGTSSRSAPPPASGVGSGSVWRQALPTPTPALTAEEPVLQPTLAPVAAPPSSSSRSVANGPQPSLTPIGDAGGGLAPQPRGSFPSRTLLMTGVVLLAAGSSWAFYYLTRPPKNA